jgi:hypothetical protein
MFFESDYHVTVVLLRLHAIKNTSLGLAVLAKKSRQAPPKSCADLSLYTIGILYPKTLVSSSTGVWAHLLFHLKASVEDIDIGELNGIQSKILFWTPFLGGLASTGVCKKEWCTERPSKLLNTMGLTRWIEIAQLLSSFAWMPSYTSNDEIIDI